MFGNKKNEEAEANLSSEDITSEVNDADHVQSDLAQSDQDLNVRVSKPSVISEGFEFNGDIQTLGPLTVDGKITGNIVVESLTIGVNGFVGGVISAKSINVKGQLSGKITCQEIVVGGRSIVDGDLTYSSITIQRGGILKGDLRRE